MEAAIFLIAVAAAATGFYWAVLRRTLKDIRDTAARLKGLKSQRWHDLAGFAKAVVVLLILAYVFTR